jgi:hypothetical protein
MFKGEKTFVFWFGLVILGLASITLFSIIWFNALFMIRFFGGSASGPSVEVQVPFIVGSIAFILIGLYMMKSGIKKQ